MAEFTRTDEDYREVALHLAVSVTETLVKQDMLKAEDEVAATVKRAKAYEQFVRAGDIPSD